MICILIHYYQFQITVINKDVPADIQIVHKVGIRNGNALASGLLIGIAYHLYAIAYLKRNRRGKNRRTHLRPFRIHKDSNAVGNRTHIRYQFLKTFATCMGRIHTYYVQTCVEQLFYKINIATLVRNRCNDLCLF